MVRVSERRLRTMRTSLRVVGLGVHPVPAAVAGVVIGDLVPPVVLEDVGTLAPEATICS